MARERCFPPLDLYVFLLNTVTQSELLTNSTQVMREVLPDVFWETYLAIYIYVDELYQVPPKRITVVLFRIELQDAHDVENLTTRPDHVIQILPAGNRIWLLVCSFHPAMRVFYLLTFLAVLVTTALACVSYTLI